MMIASSVASPTSTSVLGSASPIRAVTVWFWCHRATEVEVGDVPQVAAELVPERQIQVVLLC